MKLRTSILALLFLMSTGLIAQKNIEGEWHGIADFGNMKLRIIFDLNYNNDELKGKMISPDEDNFEIPLSKSTYTAPQLELAVADIGLSYQGIYDEASNSFKGQIDQFGNKVDLELQREAIETPYKRPQTPKAPFPYYSEEIDIVNASLGNTISATLTLPEEDSNVPVAVMITGSGPQDRDESLAHHKPFLVIADYLTRRGYGVLRYDERGVGKSSGDFSEATSADFTRDAISVIDYLKKRGFETVGVIGHSEGGMVAAKVASSYPIEFLISLAGTGVSGKEILAKQNLDISIAEGLDQASATENNRKMMEMVEIVSTSEDLQQSEKKLEHYIDSVYGPQKAFILEFDDWKQQQILSLNTIWMNYFINYDPYTAWSKVNCPALILNGTKDLQVDKDLNFKAIESALIEAENEDFTLTPLKDHNHLFQPSTTGRVSEYGDIEITISDQTLKLMSQWLDAHFK